jgi:cell division septation protein DedD
LFTEKLTKISMGPGTVRNLTYLAVGLCVFALIYLINQSIKKKERDRLAVAEGSMSGSMGDSASTMAVTTTLGGGSPATNEQLGAAGSSAAAAGALVKPVTPTAASTTTVRTPASTTAAAGTVAEASPVNHSKTGLTTKGGSGSSGEKAATATETKTYTTAGDKGNFWVIAGSFKDAAGANARVADLKKKGFAYATAVKDETSGNVRVVAAKFPYNGGAEAEVRNLKAKQVDAFIAKQ